MSVEQVSTHKVNFKSNTPFIDFEGQSPEMYKKLVIENSMFDFFPYCESYIQDKAGIFINNAYFVESLDIDISIEDQRDNSKLGHTFVWSENQMLDTDPKTYVSGDNIFILISKYERKNNRKRKLYNGKISDIIRSIVVAEFEIESAKIFIDETTGVTTETRNNETASEFIQRLATYAYSKNTPTSPFMTFITTNGEFYFKALDTLYRFGRTTNTYSFTFDIETTTDEYAVQRYELLSGGMPVNKENYIKEISYLTDSGEFTQDKRLLEDFIVQDQTNRKVETKFPLVKKFVGTEIRDEDFFGLLIDNEDQNYYQGYVNGTYLDSLLSHRMVITVHHKNNLIAGNKITLKLDGDQTEEALSVTFGGDWLILEDTHYIDGDLVPYTELILVKCGINVNENNRFRKEFI